MRIIVFHFRKTSPREMANWGMYRGNRVPSQVILFGIRCHLLQGGSARGDVRQNHERKPGPGITEQEQQVAKDGRVPGF